MNHDAINKNIRKQFMHAEKTFYQQLSDYQDQLDALKIKKRWTINKAVMRETDTLATTTESALSSYHDLKTKLHHHYQRVVQKVNEKEKLASSYTYTIEDELTLDTGRSMISEANDLLLSDHILLAIDKVSETNHFFSETISTIRNRWLAIHQQTITFLYQ
ncbi:MAG: hypothetical protein HQK75_17065 [Candidatus Magnetomorum sp.]|nr:hypothetical protein [Candidatus Magnetomorum sp.]